MSVKRVLLVDDEEDILNVIKVMVASWGYDVITAMTGEEALEIIKDNKTIDAVVLDIMMPGIDGIETLRRIRSFNKQLPVFMLTAYPSLKNMREAEKLGISGFIQKGAEFRNASEVIRIALKGNL